MSGYSPAAKGSSGQGARHLSVRQKALPVACDRSWLGRMIQGNGPGDCAAVGKPDLRCHSRFDYNKIPEKLQPLGCRIVISLLRFARLRVPVLCFVVGGMFASARGAEVATFEQLEETFQTKIRPLLKDFCGECHNHQTQEGDLDLQRFDALTQVRANPRLWQKVLFMIDNEEMPPADSPPLPPGGRRSLRSWVQAYLRAEAEAGAGDPGRVVLRRLNNVELNRSVRDLTGIDLQPTRNFPADSVAGEGFANTGESLVMSPALFEKYVDAAKQIAAHAVLLPDGIRFSGSPHWRDWEQDLFEQIKGIYHRYADEEGLLPVEDYLVAALQFREQGGGDERALFELAQQAELSPIYLQRLWKTLQAAPREDAASWEMQESVPEASRWFVMDVIRTEWQRATAADYARLLQRIKTLQESSWEIDDYTVVWRGDWQTERRFALAAQQEFRLPVEGGGEQEDFGIQLVAIPSAAGRSQKVLWKNPRFEIDGAPPIYLRTLLPDLDYASAEKDALLGEAPGVELLRVPRAAVVGRSFVVEGELWQDDPQAIPVHLRVEKVGPHWRDRSENRNHSLSFQGEPLRQPELVNGRPTVAFTGNEHLFLTNSKQLRLPEFTITAVVEASPESPAGVIYSNYDNPINWGKGVVLRIEPDGNIYFFTTAGTEATYDRMWSSEPLTEGHHIVSVTYDTEYKRIYLDGKLVGEAVSKPLEYNARTLATVGSLRGFGEPFTGKLANLTILSGTAAGPRQAAERILSEKYAIALAAAVPNEQPKVSPLWRDRSENGNHSRTFHGEPTRQPEALRGRPTVKFSGREHLFLTNSKQLRLPEFTITAVVEASAGSPAGVIYSNYDNPINWGKGVVLRIEPDRNIYFSTTAGTEASYDRMWSSEPLTEGHHIVSVTYDAEHKRIYLDGKLVGEVVSKPLEYNDRTRAVVGSLREFGEGFTGNLANLTILSGTGPAPRQAAERILSRKYGIALDRAGEAAETVALEVHNLTALRPVLSLTAEDYFAPAPAVPETADAATNLAAENLVVENLEALEPFLSLTAEDYFSANQFVPALEPTARAPLVAAPSSPLWREIAAQTRQFRETFPLGLCFNEVAPGHVDQITLRVYYREDQQLRRLMLDAAQRAHLDRLWEELDFVGQGAIREYDGFDVFIGFTTQVSQAETTQFETYREPTRLRAEALRKKQIDSEPAQVAAALQLADRAWRRPLSSLEEEELRDLYDALRQSEVGHEEALRTLLAEIFVSPQFLFRLEVPAEGKVPQPVSDAELATRLSYFLWSSLPDAELRAVADAGSLTADFKHDTAEKRSAGEVEELVRQSQRMRQDPRIRGLATEFACQWLGIRDFDLHDEKNESQYPSFESVRDDMYEEVIRFLVDLFQRDGSVLELLDSDHTFVNAELAAHYGLRGVVETGWQRVEGMQTQRRGGILGMAALLSKQSGATRTSPVLRGNWVVETLLGEQLPDPPATVPELPDTINREGLTVRQLTEMHTSLASCANCHQRIDPFGFALESFDAIGRFRETDLVGQPVDTQVRLRDGTEFQGMEGLKSYLLTERREDFLRQFCQKLLGFALGRAVQLSDEPLLEEMVERLKAEDFRFSAALKTIVRSQQFRFHRAREATKVDSI